jgi:hypothetical protein
MSKSTTHSGTSATEQQTKETNTMSIQPIEDLSPQRQEMIRRMRECDTETLTALSGNTTLTDEDWLYAIHFVLCERTLDPCILRGQGAYISDTSRRDARNALSDITDLTPYEIGRVIIDEAKEIGGLEDYKISAILRESYIPKSRYGI